jgi:hypothetical protein
MNEGDVIYLYAAASFFPALREVELPGPLLR